jgi:aspartyl-tRNA(Asn)/glutamyl-tRNA(Gln) amidotransferase subunit A
MTATVMDAALTLDAIAGYDPKDPGSIDVPAPYSAAAIGAPNSSLRIGIPRAFFYDGLHPDTQAAIEVALAVLKTITRTQHNIAPLVEDSTYSSVSDPHVMITAAEAYTYHREYISRSPELYQVATLNRIRTGADVSASAYIQSRRSLDQTRRSIRRVFESVDLIVTPTMPVPPPAIADLSDPVTSRPQELIMLRNTRLFNFFGLPTISVPCGFTKAGLPIGLQITGPPNGEAAVLRLAHAYEQATEWHKRRPILS